eukprot:1131773-Pelagomonas_calceolata.AAC.1
MPRDALAWLRWQLLLYHCLLAQEKARPSIPESSSPIPNLVYFPDLKDVLKFHMRAKHRLGHAGSKTGYYTYYRSLLPMQ